MIQVNVFSKSKLLKEVVSMCLEISFITILFTIRIDVSLFDDRFLSLRINGNPPEFVVCRNDTDLNVEHIILL